MESFGIDKALNLLAKGMVISRRKWEDIYLFMAKNKDNEKVIFKGNFKEKTVNEWQANSNDLLANDYFIPVSKNYVYGIKQGDEVKLQYQPKYLNPFVLRIVKGGREENIYECYNKIKRN